MRMTVVLDDALLSKARELSGIQERSALLHEALTAHCRPREFDKAVPARWLRSRSNLGAKAPLGLILKLLVDPA